ncbi:hypothetical protein COU54_04555 [Candidatus Pacearchaeota archaeon CG10_big_fil_rev_8_21_14_0_10_31_24]|nr:MAG: hypothetical protein COU54_04555 [Candidatus Pacearchaeota archaeon CG10_big_fil_rev_8_21_14_0_10_31_24]
MINKKGQIAMALLVAVFLVVSLVTLGAFVYFDKDIKVQSGELSQVIQEKEFVNDYVYWKAISIGKEVVKKGQSENRKVGIKDYQEFAKDKNYGVKGAEDFFSKVENGEFIFEFEDGKYNFEMKKVRIVGDKGLNVISSNRDLKFSLD